MTRCTRSMPFSAAKRLPLSCWADARVAAMRRYPSREAMGQLSFSELEIRPVGECGALALGIFRLDRPPVPQDEGMGRGDERSLQISDDSAPPTAVTGRFTLVLQRTMHGDAAGGDVAAASGGAAEENDEAGRHHGGMAAAAAARNKHHGGWRIIHDHTST